jgi:hypothetical protein
LKFSNSEGVQHRDDRLKKCARLTAKIFGITEQQLSALIDGMHDTRGTLHVRWVHMPSPKATLAVESAWEECGETSVRHDFQITNTDDL